MPFTDPSEKMAHARQQMAVKYLDEARDQFARLGVEPTEEQLAAAGDRLLKQAMRDRLDIARKARWTQQRHRQAEFAVGQALKYLDQIMVFEPTLDRRVMGRVLCEIARDELDSPDGFKAPRLGKRLQLYLDRAKADASKRSERLEATLLPELRLEEDNALSADELGVYGPSGWSGLGEQK